MALIEAEEELFGLRDPQEPIHLNDISGSEEEYDDDDAGENAARQPAAAQEDQADGATDPSAAKVVKPKRVIKNPQPKLDVARLCGPRGIGIIQKFLSDAKYRGKGYETEDLGMLLKKLQHWAHRLYPKLPFLDTITHIEKLGNKKGLQVNVKRLRLDMYETPEEGTVDGLVKDDAERAGEGGDVPPDDEQPDVFDELLRQSGAGLHERVTASARTEAPAALPLPPSQPIVLTDEQKARIERNKQLALARRQAMLAAAASRNTPAASGTTDPTLGSQATSNKRSRDEALDGEDSDEERIQPTPAELRNLREGLLSGVVSSQNNVVTDKNTPSNDKENSSSIANKNPDFEDDFEDMDVDDVLSALNKADDKVESAVTVGLVSEGGDGGSQESESVKDSSPKPVPTTSDKNQPDEESNLSLPSSSVEAEPEQTAPPHEPKSVDRHDQETNDAVDVDCVVNDLQMDSQETTDAEVVSNDSNEVGNKQQEPEHLETPSKRQGQEADELSESDTEKSEACQETETGSSGNDAAKESNGSDAENVDSLTSEGSGTKTDEEPAHTVTDKTNGTNNADAVPNSLDETESVCLEKESADVSR